MPVVHSLLIPKCILILLWERFLEIERLGWTMAVFINEHISQREPRTEKWMGRSWKRNSLPPSSSAIRGMQRQTIVGEVSEYWREEYAGGGGGRYFPQNPTRILTTCWQTISGEKFVVTNTNLWDRQSGFQCSVRVQCIFISHCWTEFTHSLDNYVLSPPQQCEDVFSVRGGGSLRAKELVWVVTGACRLCWSNSPLRLW